jgi:hypothetical protein
MVFATVALSQRGTAARWVCAGIGTLVMAIPFLFNTGNAAAYLSDSLVGALIFGFAVALKPEPGPSALAALTWAGHPSRLELQPLGLDAAPAHHRHCA